MTCPFCDHSHSLLESSLVLARLDKYPVSPGHTLVTTKRHISNYFEATLEEVRGLWQLVGEVKQYLDSKHQPTQSLLIQDNEHKIISCTKHRRRKAQSDLRNYWETVKYSNGAHHQYAANKNSTITAKPRILVVQIKRVS